MHITSILVLIKLIIIMHYHILDLPHKLNNYVTNY